MVKREKSKKGLYIFAIVLIFVFLYKRCSADPPPIEGRIIEYRRVEEYTCPIATVVDNKGNTSYIAIMCDAVTINGVYDQKSMDGMHNGTLLDVYIEVAIGSEGSTIELDGKTVTVHEAYQIRIKDIPLT